MSERQPDQNSVQIATIGHIFNENIQFPDRSIGPLLGSTVAYSSVALGRLGARVGIVSNVGTDIPRSLLAPIVESGVDIKGLHRSGKFPTTTTLLVYDPDGYKVIRYLKKAPRIRFDDIPKTYLSAKIAFFCAVDFDVSAETVRKVKSTGITTAADLGGFGGAHTSKEEMQEFANNRSRILRSYAENIDIGKASLEDCYHLFGDGGLTEKQALTQLLDTGIGIAVVTLGERGAVIATSDGTTRIPAAPTQVVDTTGAGDVFMAAFLLEYLNTGDLYKAGLFAGATASLLIEKSGGVSIDRLPDFHQVRRRLGHFQDSISYQ
jgi:sugar/nucleoside kinase (ribokinase family)